jgi:cytochrome c553
MKRGVAIIGLCFMLGQAAGADTSSPPLDSIDQRARTCVPCHGKEGRATTEGYYPRIAGKPAGYLFNQLLNFRAGRRYFPMMAYLTDRQGDDYLRELATYFASQQVPYPPPEPAKVDEPTLGRGRQLAKDGDADHDIPSCASCHGANLLGTAPAVPGLVGVSRDYLVAQIGAWRNGNRHAAAPDCMAQLVQRLSPQDIGAVTAWLAAQTVQEGAQPETRFERAPPVTCGSIQAPGSEP